MIPYVLYAIIWNIKNKKTRIKNKYNLIIQEQGACIEISYTYRNKYVSFISVCILYTIYKVACLNGAKYENACE